MTANDIIIANDEFTKVTLRFLLINLVVVKIITSREATNVITAAPPQNITR